MKTKTRALLLLSLATALTAPLAGCSTARGRADDLMSSGQYLRAAEVYDQIVAAHPDDHEARALRDQARGKALLGQLAETQSYRTRQNTSEWLGAYDRLLTKRAEWSFKSDGALEKGISVENEAVGVYAKSIVTPHLQAAHPLRAEEAARAIAPMHHPELASVRAEIAGEVLKVGRAQCNKLSESVVPETPYWGFVVNGYCQHWGGTLTSAVPLPPHVRSGVTITGGLEGSTEAQSANLRARIAGWFAASRWYAPNAPLATTGSIEGRNAARFSSRRVFFDKGWSESVPYTAIESYREPYTETYYDTEYYTESVPYTDYETYQYSCGNSTCTGSRSVTRHRSESRSRTVPRTRTRWRNATRIVTRYRDEPRVFHYEADEITGVYTSAITVRLDMGAGVEPILIRTARDASGSGISHNVTFDPAGVSPQTPNLPSQGTFFESEVTKLGEQVTSALAKHFDRSFCSAATYDLESASRCAYGSTNYPVGVGAIFATVVGDDAPLLPSVLLKR